MKFTALDGWIDVFRAGTWTDSAGKTRTFGEADLDGYVAKARTADPIPVVIGHPKHDDPAWAFVSELRREGDRLQAKLRDIEPAFREAVEAGRYGGRSIALRGGTLAHVGFLGAKAPSVPGLAPTQFSGEPDHVFNAFSDNAWAFQAVGRLFRGLRDRLIETDGMETADRVMPSWEIEAVENIEMSGTPDATISTEVPMGPTKEELDARKAELDRREQELRQRDATFARREKLVEIDGLLADHVKAGRVLPAERPALAALLAGLPGDELTFAAPDGATVAKSARDVLMEFVAALPSRIDTSTRAGGPIPGESRTAAFAAPDGTSIDEGSISLYNRAKSLEAEKNITFVEAVRLAEQEQLT